MIQKAESVVPSGSLDRPGHPGQLAPIRAELECHDDSGDDAEPERDAKNLEPKLEYDTVGRAPGPLMQRLQHSQPRCEPDREGRKNDMERDSVCKLQPREQKCSQIHR
jgi:hypothetical protein